MTDRSPRLWVVFSVLALCNASLHTCTRPVEQQWVNTSGATCISGAVIMTKGGTILVVDANSGAMHDSGGWCSWRMRIWIASEGRWRSWGRTTPSPPWRARPWPPSRCSSSSRPAMTVCEPALLSGTVCRPQCNSTVRAAHVCHSTVMTTKRLVSQKLHWKESSCMPRGP